MFFWFIGLSLLFVSIVFDSAAVDHRTLALGAVLPAAEVLTGRALVMHTLAGAIMALVAVMLVLRGRRLAQRRWLGLPIGLFLHLVLDFTWTDTELFWWPATGFALEADAPEVARPIGVVVFMELVGIAAFVLLARLHRTSPVLAVRSIAATGRLPATRHAST